MQLGRDKMAYMIVYGIAPFLKQNLLDEILVSEHFVVDFDESINKVSQKQQMDINIRFWDRCENRVKTWYLTSAFLGWTRASDLLEAFTEATKPLDLKRLVQLSMDGPNVNKKLFKDLQAQIKELTQKSCGLHAINVAFKAGAVVTQWKILEFQRALYYLFNKSPARRARYSFYSGSTLFPKKFGAIRWLENSDVANRVLDMLPHLMSYVDAVEKNKEAPCSNSYNLIKEAIKDKLLPTKLTFFRSVACEFEGFLREYQTDVPLIPFLFSDLSVLL
ncbi:hypothetical protein AVEN_47705-1 [Araneus ventricosus]|uniref:Uncharacterized protein n=1 Tax=Araneus ventricosus TaxID=182803 RepID=A0A4Y2P873_ARAVE|nr:hypothetical protein AVEN_47705-1 [Araneus ventricosus]